MLIKFRGQLLVLFPQHKQFPLTNFGYASTSGTTILQGRLLGLAQLKAAACQRECQIWESLRLELESQVVDPMNLFSVFLAGLSRCELKL